MKSVKRQQQLMVEIAERQEELTKIEKELEALDKMLPEEALAIVIHDITCTHNHTDGCGWFYEIKKNVHDWNAATHKGYLKIANKLHEFCNSRGITRNEIATIVTLARDY